jgi:peptidoglycan/LPS O-acetylase OafA/YrhL
MERRVSHIPALDGVRGLAIVLVVLFHSGLIINGSSSTEKLWLQSVSFGWAGVDLFFVLSGYLISSILINARESKYYFRNFFARRAVRIFPLYFASLAILYTYRFADPDFQWWYWLFAQNWIPILNGTAQPIAMQPYWSLAVEEQFYLIWPFVIYLLKPNQVSRFCYMTIAAVFAARCYAKVNGVDPWAITITTPFRMDALAMGALVATVYQQSDIKALRKTGWRFAAIGTLTVLGISFYEGGYRMDGFLAQTLGYTMFAAACAGLIAVIVSHEGSSPGVLRFFESKVLQHLGNRSYAIYVMHMPLLVMMTVIYQQRLANKDQSGSLDIQCFMIVIVVCLILAELSWHLFEKQFLKLKKHFPRNV